MTQIKRKIIIKKKTYNQYKSNKRADIIVLKLYYQAHAPDIVLQIMKKGNPDEDYSTIKTLF